MAGADCQHVPHVQGADRPAQVTPAVQVVFGYEGNTDPGLVRSLQQRPGQLRLTRLDHACAGRSFAQHRDTAIIAVLKATGIRLSELTGPRYDLGDPRCSDIDLWQREITVRGKGGKNRIVRIGHQATRSLDRYLRARSRHVQAWRSQLWLGRRLVGTDLQGPLQA